MSYKHEKMLEIKQENNEENGKLERQLEKAETSDNLVLGNLTKLREKICNYLEIEKMPVKLQENFNELTQEIQQIAAEFETVKEENLPEKLLELASLSASLESLKQEISEENIYNLAKKEQGILTILIRR